MWKALRRTCALLSLYLISNSAFGVESSHLLNLKGLFPYGLLGDDYGVLSVKDVASNACEYKPKPFPPTPFIDPYQYWQCFESKSISLKCDSSGVRDEIEGAMGLFVVNASAAQTDHEYMQGRPEPIRDCTRSLRDVAAILKGTRHACISGSFLDNETDGSGRRTTNWLFDRIKTNKGCEGQGCDFTDKFKREHCPNLKSS